jgi:hypothetical protein
MRFNKQERAQWLAELEEKKKPKGFQLEKVDDSINKIIGLKKIGKIQDVFTLDLNLGYSKFSSSQIDSIIELGQTIEKIKPVNVHLIGREIPLPLLVDITTRLDSVLSNSSKIELQLSPVFEDKQRVSNIIFKLEAVRNLHVTTIFNAKETSLTAFTSYNTEIYQRVYDTTNFHFKIKVLHTNSVEETLSAMNYLATIFDKDKITVELPFNSLVRDAGYSDSLISFLEEEDHLDLFLEDYATPRIEQVTTAELWYKTCNYFLGMNCSIGQSNLIMTYIGDFFRCYNDIASSTPLFTIESLDNITDYLESEQTKTILCPHKRCPFGMKYKKVLGEASA